MTRRWIGLWMLTFLGYPLGGLLVIETVGSIDGELSAAAGGVLAGAVLGLAQWLVLRRSGVPVHWVAVTAVGMGIGTVVAVVLVGTETGLGDLTVRGLIAGLVVGAAQSVLLAHDVRIGAIWTLTVGGAWSVGWLTTTSAGIDVERGYVTFGASGALCATLLTGLVMWHALRCRPAPGSSDLHEATPPQPEVTLTHT